MGLDEDRIMTTFQSRFGREPWLQPYTDKTLEAMPAEGTKHVAVICPGFSSDCLETIEEIDGEGREIFIEHGGETFHYIPCLNAQPAHLEALAEIAGRHL
jgi:ferrochelatase